MLPMHGAAEAHRSRMAFHRTLTAGRMPTLRQIDDYSEPSPQWLLEAAIHMQKALSALRIGFRLRVFLV